jgi:hypothetical protein
MNIDQEGVGVCVWVIQEEIDRWTRAFLYVKRSPDYAQ